MITKIGIGIVHCQSSGSTNIGYTVVFKSDNGEWSSIIDDTGSVFRHVKINDGTTILKMIHISEDGWYMCSMKPIPGRDEEYRASWVYFPSSLELSQKNIEDIIDVAESQIKEKEYDENILRETVQKYQKSNENGKLLYKILPTQSDYAFYDISGNFNTHDLYGHIYQKEFFKYKWVLLMDKSSLKFKKEDAVQEISDKEFVDSYVGIKPDGNDLLGFTPYLDGKKFCSPVQIMEGEVLSVEFQKDGYMSFKKEIKSQNDFSISKDDCKRYFYKKQFVACDGKTGKRIYISTNDCIRPLNASEDGTKSKWIFSEQDLESAKFDVEVEGYMRDKFDLDLRNKSLDEEISISLDPENHEYVFVLPLDRSVVKDHETVEIKICSQYVIKESPLKHYRCSGMPREGGFPNQLSVVFQSTNGYYSRNNGKYNTEYNDNKEKVTKAQASKPTCESTKSPGSNGVTKENPNHTPSNHVKKHKIIFLSIIIVAVAAVGFCCIVYLNPFNEDTKMEQVAGDDTPPKVLSSAGSDNSITNSDDDEWRKAYDYLQKETIKIYKKKMDVYSALEGLYEILNEYRFEDFIKYIDSCEHKREILKINVWKRLYENAKKIGKNKEGRKYNDEGKEQSITFERYFERIRDKFLSSSDQTQQQGGTFSIGEDKPSSDTNQNDNI